MHQAQLLGIMLALALSGVSVISAVPYTSALNAAAQVTNQAVSVEPAISSSQVTIDSEDPVAAGLHGLLPGADELGENWTVQNEGERTREEVIELLGDQGGELIETLEWKANAFRNFERTSITDPGSFYEPTQLTVSIHAFVDNNNAADALQPLSKWVADIESMESVQVDSSGDNAIAFSGLDGRLPAFVLYVQEGNLVIRVGAISMLGDPRDAVIEVSELILQKTNA